jgi:hypothetical protein
MDKGVVEVVVMVGERLLTVKVEVEAMVAMVVTEGGTKVEGGMVETPTMMVVEVDTVVEVDMVEEVDIKVEVVVMVEVVVEEGCLLPVGEVVVGHATIVADRATLAMIATSHVGVAGTETIISWTVLGTQYPRTTGDMGHRTMGILGLTKQ